MKKKRKTESSPSPGSEREAQDRGNGTKRVESHPSESAWKITRKPKRYKGWGLRGGMGGQIAKTGGLGVAKQRDENKRKVSFKPKG